MILSEKKRVLVVGDIHLPFEKEGYLEFCIEQYKQFQCDTVVFIGDIIDQHFASFHTTDPDGYGAGEELERAVTKLAKWNEAFPQATVLIGNHDAIIMRKAFEGAIPKIWIRDFKDVLGTPNWEYVHETVIDGVGYNHGMSSTAKTKAKNDARSTVQGHRHSEGYIEFINNNMFAMQVGTGIDDTAYAFAYNKGGKRSILSCGIVLEGTQPLLIKF